MYIEIASLTIANNATTFTVNSGEDISGISPNSILFVAGATLPAQVSYTAGAPLLVEPWAESGFTAVKARIFVGVQGLVDAIDSAKAVSDNLNTKTDEVNAIIAGQGAAATKDVTTSSTDTTAGRVLQVGDGGLLGNSPTATNLDTIFRGGTYNYTNTTTGRPDEGYGEVVVVSGADDTRVIQKAINHDTLDYYFRSYTGTWAPWQEIWHSGNLNVKKVSANQSGDFLMFGYASNATTAIFQRPVNGLPTGITQTGTFTVRLPGVSNQSGITVNFDSGSCDGILLVNVTNLTGLTTGDALVLVADSSASEITWDI